MKPTVWAPFRRFFALFYGIKRLRTLVNTPMPNANACIPKNRHHSFQCYSCSYRHFLTYTRLVHTTHWWFKTPYWFSKRKQAIANVNSAQTSKISQAQHCSHWINIAVFISIRRQEESNSGASLLLYCGLIHYSFAYAEKDNCFSCLSRIPTILMGQMENSCTCD